MEEQILQEVKAVLGFGKVYQDDSGAFRYRVTDREDIFKLAILFNGNLATIEKVNQLGLWIVILTGKWKKSINHETKLFIPTLTDS